MLLQLSEVRPTLGWFSALRAGSNYCMRYRITWMAGECTHKGFLFVAWVGLANFLSRKFHIKILLPLPRFQLLKPLLKSTLSPEFRSSFLSWVTKKIDWNKNKNELYGYRAIVRGLQSTKLKSGKWDSQKKRINFCTEVKKTKHSPGRSK